MVTSKINKYALIISGDAEPSHLANVKNSTEALRADGFATYVVSPVRPESAPDQYVEATAGAFNTLVTQLKQKLDNNDELFVYVTGHGEEGGFCLSDTCSTYAEVKTLSQLPFRQRTVVMAQCYGGKFLGHET